MNLSALINPLGIVLLVGAFLVIVRLSTLLARLTERVATLERQLAAGAPQPASAATSATAASSASLARSDAPAAGAVTEAADARSASAAKVTPEDFAIIAAAVSTLLGRSARIVQIAQADGGTHLPWSIEGRRSIYSSHNVRR